MTGKIPVDIVSGFLGAGKTTLIRKLLKESYQGEKVFLLENEFGQVGIDGALLARPELEMKEIYSGCICCSLKGDFTEVLLDAIQRLKPGRIIIEPTGVGKLSEILNVLNQDTFKEKIYTDQIITVLDARKALLYLRNFGQFMRDQVVHAKTIAVSKTRHEPWETLREITFKFGQLNPGAAWVTTPWDELTGNQILEAVVRLERDLLPKYTGNFRKSACSCGIDHHGHGDGQCQCGQHGNHHGEKGIQSWSWETPRVFSGVLLQKTLSLLQDRKNYGHVIRAKGIVPGADRWLHFEYVGGDWDVDTGVPQPTGKMVVIGQELNKTNLQNLFEGVV